MNQPKTNSMCPLCQSQAVCQNSFARHSKHYVCSKCKEFVIKHKAEQYLVGAAAQAREHFSDYSVKASADVVTFICFEPNGPGVVPTAQAEYLRLKEALDR